MSRGEKRPGAGRKPIAVKSIAPKTAKAIARKPAPQRTRKSKKKPLQTSAKPKLTPRQAKLLEGIAELKSQEEAARAAGYAPSTARNAHRIAEGLDALETKLVTYKGVITDRCELINWDARRAYIEIAAKYTGYHVHKQEGAEEHVPNEEADAHRIEELLALATAREKEQIDRGRTN